MFGEYGSLIERAMDVTSLQRKVNSNNIANYNTPDFKASKVVFEDLLSGEQTIKMKTSKNVHIDNNFLPYENVNTVTDTSSKERVDGNNVDLTAQMIDTIKINETYSRAVRAMNSEISLSKIALTSY